MKKILRKPAVDLTDLAIGIIVLGIVVVIGSIVLLGVRDARLTDATIATTTNETVTPTDAGVYNLANKWGAAVSVVQNGSDTVMAAGNYTVVISGVDGLISVTNVSETLGTNPANFTYTWYNTSTRDDWTLANDATTGIAEFGNWFDVIVILGVAAVILSLIFLAFGRREGGASGSY